MYYHPQDYDAKTGAPLCDVTLADSHRYYHTRHSRHYPWYDQVLFSFWPLTTPNLKALYLIDREIKLRPGVVSIPAGATTFQGNGCVFVEVSGSSSSHRRSRDNDGVWQYPRPCPFGGDVFHFARHVRRGMAQLQSRFHMYGVHRPDMEPMIEACTAQGVRSPHNRAIHSGEVPRSRCWLSWTTWSRYLEECHQVSLLFLCSILFCLQCETVVTM
jgi:hypothetical protein